MGNLSGVDMSTITPNDGEYTPVPNGNYKVAMVKSEKVINSKQTGKIFNLEFQITEGTYYGKIIKETLNWEHTNLVCVQIGQGRMSAISHAIGLIPKDDTSELHNKPLIIEVICEKYFDKNGEEKQTNSIKSFHSLSQPPNDVPVSQPEPSTTNLPPTIQPQPLTETPTIPPYKPQCTP